MSLRYQVVRSRRSLLVLLTAAVLAFSAGGVQFMLAHSGGQATETIVACAGPCDDPGGG